MLSAGEYVVRADGSKITAVNELPMMNPISTFGRRETCGLPGIDDRLAPHRRLGLCAERNGHPGGVVIRKRLLAGLSDEEGRPSPI